MLSIQIAVNSILEEGGCMEKQIHASSFLQYTVDYGLVDGRCVYADYWRTVQQCGRVHAPLQMGGKCCPAP